MKWHLTFLRKDSEEFWELEVNKNSYSIREGKTGTLGTIDTLSFQSEEERLGTANALIKEKQKEGYILKTIPPFRHADLPVQIRSKLKSGLIVHTSKGQFEFAFSDKIKVLTVVVNKEFNYSLNEPSLNKNSERGLFITTAYSLIENVPDRGIQGTLVWIPAIQKFASWHEKIFQLYVFNNTTWEDIEMDLLQYLVVEDKLPSINPLQIDTGLASHFDFIPNHLPDQIGEILNTKNPDEQQTKAVSFLSTYEQLLSSNPFSVHLESCFSGLGRIYYNLGQGQEEKGDYVKAVQYFQKAVFIALQSTRLRKELLSHLFIQLAYCYSQKGKFELALQNLDHYQLFDSSDKETCDKIRNKIKSLQKIFSTENEMYEREPDSNSLEDYNKAILILKNKLDAKPHDPQHHYLLACFYSIIKKKVFALEHLEQALENGFKDQLKITLEARFRNIRDTPKFSEMLEKQFGEVS